MNLLIDILLILGLIINFLSILGLLRMPDVYTRLHAGTKTTTLGSIFIVASVVVYNYCNNETSGTVIIVHSLIALFVIIFTNPISAHAIARSALITGIKPEQAEVDEYNNPFKKNNSINETSGEEESQ